MVEADSLRSRDRSAKPLGIAARGTLTVRLRADFRSEIERAATVNGRSYSEDKAGVRVMTDPEMPKRVAAAWAAKSSSLDIIQRVNNGPWEVVDQVSAGENGTALFSGSDIECEAWVRLQCASAAIESMRELPQEVAVAHAVGFLRTWTDPWDCLGPQEEEAFNLEIGGDEMHEEAYLRIADFAGVAWRDAIDTALGKKITDLPEINMRIFDDYWPKK